jgi:hypothetical protein
MLAKTNVFFFGFLIPEFFSDSFHRLCWGPLFDLNCLDFRYPKWRKQLHNNLNLKAKLMEENLNFEKRNY